MKITAEEARQLIKDNQPPPITEVPEWIYINIAAAAKRLETEILIEDGNDKTKAEYTRLLLVEGYNCYGFPTPTGRNNGLIISWADPIGE